MKSYISPETIPSKEELTGIANDANSLLTRAKKIKISLSKEERSKGRKMGSRRLAYAESALRHSIQQIDEMPRSFDPTNFEKLMSYYQEMEKIRIIVSQLSEILDDTNMAIRIDAMTNTKIVHDAIKSSNNVNPALDAVLDELDEFNKHAQQDDTEMPTDTTVADNTTPTE